MLIEHSSALVTTSLILFVPSSSSSLSALVLEDDVEGVNDAGNEAQTGEGNVDQQIDAAALLGEHANGRQNERQDDLANVTAGEWHLEVLVLVVVLL